MADGIVKFQAKLEVLVLIYTVVHFIFKCKYCWPKVLKVVLLMAILKYKYFTHYGTQAAWREIHLTLDSLSKKLSIRRYYQQFSGIFSLLGNQSNHRKVVLL